MASKNMRNTQLEFIKTVTSNPVDVRESFINFNGMVSSFYGH